MNVVKSITEQKKYHNKVTKKCKRNDLINTTKIEREN
jgi:hypothetical protein